MDRESVPISGQSPANFGACQIHPCSAAVRGLHPSRQPPFLALDRRNRCCAGSRDFTPPLPPATLSVSHLSARVQNPARSLSLLLARSLRHARPSYQPPGARWRVCVRVAGEKPPAMIAVYGREKPSRSDDIIAISNLLRNSIIVEKKNVVKNEAAIMRNDANMLI